jgi:hypothetical protein
MQNDFPEGRANLSTQGASTLLGSASSGPYHGPLSADEKRPAGEAAGCFETTILDNLRKAGVQNTKREERLAFDPPAARLGQDRRQGDQPLWRRGARVYAVAERALAVGAAG